MRFLLFIFILEITSSCITNKKDGAVNNKKNSPAFINELNLDYQKRRSFFPKELINHFPDKLTENHKSLSESVSPECGEISFFILDSCDKKEIKSFIQKYNNKIKGKYKSTDTCLLVLNRFATKKENYNLKVKEEYIKQINKECYIDKFPIPNFWVFNKYSTNETECKLLKDFEIYVIDAKQGKYLEDKYLTDGRFMPPAWKNGCSKGVAISKNRLVIIYWVIIW